MQHIFQLYCLVVAKKTSQMALHVSKIKRSGATKRPSITLSSWHWTTWLIRQVYCDLGMTALPIVLFRHGLLHWLQEIVCSSNPAMSLARLPKRSYTAQLQGVPSLTSAGSFGKLKFRRTSMKYKTQFISAGVDLVNGRAGLWSKVLTQLIK